MSCCAGGINGCLDLRRLAFPIDGQASAKWNRYPGSMGRRDGDSVAPSWRNSAGWMPARIRRFSVGLGRKYPVSVRKASLMTESMRQVWALRHQTWAQYSAVEWTRTKVAVLNVVAPAPQPKPARHPKSAMRDVNFLRSDSRCRRYVRALSNITPRYMSSDQKSRVSLLWLNFSSRSASLLLRWKRCDRKSQAAYAQSFALWQQGKIEFTCHDHSVIACSRHIHVWCCSSRTSRSWWITQSTQHHRKGCNRRPPTLLL